VLLEDVLLVLGLIDTVMPDSLPGWEVAVIVVEAAVGSIHCRVLLAAYTHWDMCVPLGEVQLMYMKPVVKAKIIGGCTANHRYRYHQTAVFSHSHSPQVGMFTCFKSLLTLFQTEQTSRPEMCCLRVMLCVSVFPEKSSESVRAFPSRVQLY